MTSFHPKCPIVLRLAVPVTAFLLAFASSSPARAQVKVRSSVRLEVHDRTQELRAREPARLAEWNRNRDNARKALNPRQEVQATKAVAEQLRPLRNPPLIEAPSHMMTQGALKLEHLAFIASSIGPLSTHSAPPFLLKTIKIEHPEYADAPPEIVVKISKGKERSTVRIVPTADLIEKRVAENRDAGAHDLVLLQASRHPLEALQDLGQKVNSVRVLDYAPRDEKEYEQIFGRRPDKEVKFGSSEFPRPVSAETTVADHLRDPKPPEPDELTILIAHIDEKGLIHLPDGSTITTGEVMFKNDSNRTIVLGCATNEVVVARPGLHIRTYGKLSVDQARAMAATLKESGKKKDATRMSVLQDLQEASDLVRPGMFWAPATRLEKKRPNAGASS
jgi:hypothetical protein